MLRYTVGGITVVTAATADHAVAELWNASASSRLEVFEISVALTAATAVQATLRRSTAKGTPGSTITPTIVNNHQRLLAPPSGCTLELAAFSAQPTLEALKLHTFHLPASVGTGIMWNFGSDPIIVPAGNGLVLTTGTAVAFPVSTVMFSWGE